MWNWEITFCPVLRCKSISAGYKIVIDTVQRAGSNLQGIFISCNLIPAAQAINTVILPPCVPFAPVVFRIAQYVLIKTHRFGPRAKIAVLLLRLFQARNNLIAYLFRFWIVIQKVSLRKTGQDFPRKFSVPHGFCQIVMLRIHKGIKQPGIFLQDSLHPVHLVSG